MEGKFLSRENSGEGDAPLLRFTPSRSRINNTFYRLPQKSMLENWKQQVPEGFRFQSRLRRRSLISNASTVF